MKRRLLGLLAVLLFSALAQAQYVTLTGTLGGANGSPAADYTLTFTPSQIFFVAGTSIVVPNSVNCATSVDGSVVGIPNPLAVVAVTSSFTGTLSPGNYYVEYSYYTATTGTLVSPEMNVQLTSTGSITVPAPGSGIPSGATGMNVYIGSTSGGETLQGQTAGNASYVQSSALVAGASPAAINSTVCKLIANDAGWPTGTGYKVALTDTQGNVQPNYPMMWQLLGPGTTINISTGLPYYNGVVTYPVPILASPYNHNPQSISGNLNMNGYDIDDVGTLYANNLVIPNYMPTSIDGVLYADQCAGNDIGARINSCLASLPTNSSGYKVGQINLPNTSTESGMSTWSTPVVLGPGTSLHGQGPFSSVFSCTVSSGACLTHNASAGCALSPASTYCPGNPLTGPNVHTTNGTVTTWDEFSIIGNGASGQDEILLKDAQGLTMQDINVDGASESGGSCIHLDDVWWWTERNEFKNVNTLYGCSTGWRFTTETANPFNPHPSFGYNRFLNIKTNPTGTGQVALSFEGNSYLYNDTFNVTINQKTGANAINMSGNAEYYINDTHIFGESDGTGLFLNIASATNQFGYNGAINYNPQTNSIATGAVVIHWLDDAGYGTQGNQIYGGLFSEEGSFSSYYANPLAVGSDLNSATLCGTFWVKNPLNAPPVPSPPSPAFYHVTNACSGTFNDYIYQTASLYYQPKGQIVYSRVLDDAGWSAWSQFAQTFPGVTGALPTSAIAAGACTNLSASVPGATSQMVITASPVSNTGLNPGLYVGMSFVPTTGTVTVPICNATSSSITPSSMPAFEVRAQP